MELTFPVQAELQSLLEQRVLGQRGNMTQVYMAESSLEFQVPYLHTITYLHILMTSLHISISM